MSEMANPKLSVDEQSALDAQFDTRAAVPEHPMMFARWAERSAQARLDLGTLMDLKYGPHPRQRIDLVDAGMHSPLLVFLHGGFWRAFDKSAFTFIAPPFVDHGISVAVVDYALCPEVTVREVCDQVATAVAYLREVAPNHSFDAERTVLAGHSVGAHMAVWLGGVDWTTRGLTSQPYHGVVAISGIYDLVPVSRSFLNADLTAAARIHIPKNLMHRRFRVKGGGAAQQRKFIHQVRIDGAHLEQKLDQLGVAARGQRQLQLIGRAEAVGFVQPGQQRGHNVLAVTAQIVRAGADGM